MANKTNLISAALFLLLTSACSDSEQGAASTAASAKNEKQMEKSIDTSRAANDVEDTSKKEKIVLQQLIQEAEQARTRANELGYEWNTIGPLMEQGHAAVKDGNQELAISLFNKAKQHSELAIAQAKYAEQNWTILVPR